MDWFLTLAYLFFIGSLLGWVLELFYRHRFDSAANPQHKWINPGFCVGPYVPLYGFGLCILYLLAYCGDIYGLNNAGHRTLLFLGMAVSMTAIEYIAGVMLLKIYKIRLWDYTDEWANFKGLICPKYSLFWAIASAAYYFGIHPHILDALEWLSENLAFSFVIGFFFGVFSIDVAYSAHLVSRMKEFAEENEIIVRFEHLKAQIREAEEKVREKKRFFFPFRSSRTLSEHLIEAYGLRDALKHKNKG